MASLQAFVRDLMTCFWICAGVVVFFVIWDPLKRDSRRRRNKDQPIDLTGCRFGDRERR